MLGKKKEPVIALDTKCKTCGLECGDQNTLKRHMGWKHPEIVAVSGQK